MIAVDWGTTNLRTFLVDEAGKVLARHSSNAGVMKTAPGQFAAVLRDSVGEWLAEGAGPILMCGMVGSRQGWKEVPYVPCPAAASDIAAGVAEVDVGDGWVASICPGLVCKDARGVPDVLRGEETLVLGAMSSFPVGRVSVWLPGTHSKHVRVCNGIIEDFSTYMTGESFSLFAEHSILARLANGSQIDSEAFREGLRRAQEPGGLLHHLFGVRSRVLSSELAPEAVHGYLSGILIGHEVISDDVSRQEPVYVIGDESLESHYLTALEFYGYEAHSLGTDLAVAGLLRVHHAMERSTSI